jgi:hypothetical protein
MGPGGPGGMMDGPGMMGPQQQQGGGGQGESWTLALLQCSCGDNSAPVYICCVVLGMGSVVTSVVYSCWRRPFRPYTCACRQPAVIH